MSNLASLRERLQKFKMQREQREKTETTLDQTQDSTGNTTDQRSWMKKIESQGNRAEDWLQYTNFLVQNMQGVSEDTSYDYICNTYGKAIKAISSSGGHKCEAYAKLVVNYANFMRYRDTDDARELFYSARTNLGDYAIVHVYAAQFELQQDNVDKCRKIFEKAKEMKVVPSALLEAAHMNFLLGYTEFVNDELIAKYTGTPLAEQPDGKLSKFDTSRDSGISICSGRSDNTRNLTDRDFKDSSSLYHDISRRTLSTRGGSSSDDSLPLSTSLSNHAFSKPLVPKVSGTTSTMPGLIKPAPVKRDLVFSDHEAQDSPIPAAYGARNRQSMWNNAFLPDNFANNEEEEGTVSFNVADKGSAVGKRLGSGGTSEDTVPLTFESSDCQYNRPLRTSHSTPDCKNASTLSMVSSRKKRFVGKARRMLPQVEEGSTIEETTMDGLSLPIMPDFDVSRTQDFGTELGISSTSGSTTLTTSHSGQSTLVKTPTLNAQPSEYSPAQETAPGPKSSKVIITTESPSPPRPHPPQPVQLSKPQIQVQKPEPMHIETPIPKSNIAQTAAPKPSCQTQRKPAEQSPAEPARQTQTQAPPQPPPDPAPQPPPAQSTVLPPQLKPTTKQDVLVINKKVYTVLNCIGQGGSSSVFEVLDADHNLRAVKIVNMTGADEPTIKSFRNEIALLQRLQTSDRVITMYDHEFNVRSNLLYVIMERGDPDLATFFSRNKKLNDIQMLYFWQEMLEAVHVLHQQGIVHTDLKPANFMIVGGHLKLIDFGIAKAIQQDMTSVTTDQQVGTLNFMSPEALMADSYGSEEDENGQVQRKHKIGYKSDVWSLGCILYRMVYGRTPFQTIRNQLQKMRAIINPNHEIQFPPIPDARLHDVLKKCLIRDPKIRPTIDELLEHPYLRKTEEPEPAPPASIQTNETILKLMEQMATASPTSFSACKQSVQGLLEKLMAPQPAQAAGSNVASKMAPGKEREAPRSSQRTPLSSLNPPQNK